MAENHSGCGVLLTPVPAPVGHCELFLELGRQLGVAVTPAAPRSERALQILRADFLVADLTGNDPEVLYDLGIAHTFGKRVFLCTNDVESLPYDLRANRMWVFEGASQIESIRSALLEFLELPQVTGPVRMFAANYAFFGQNLFVRRVVAGLIDLALGLSVLAGLRASMLSHDFGAMGTPQFWQALVSFGNDHKSNAFLMGSMYLPPVYIVIATWLFYSNTGPVDHGIGRGPSRLSQRHSGSLRRPRAADVLGCGDVRVGLSSSRSGSKL